MDESSIFYNHLKFKIDLKPAVSVKTVKSVVKHFLKKSWETVFKIVSELFVEYNSEVKLHFQVFQVFKKILLEKNEVFSKLFF